MDRPQYFDKLPSELKMMILQSCDYRSLRSVVHASPGFHSFYLSAREELLALVTIRQLTDRGFNFFGRYNVIEAGGANESIHEASLDLYRQCQEHISTNGKHVVRLHVRASIVLLGIKHAIGWRVERVEGKRQVKLEDEKLFMRMQRDDSLLYETIMLGHDDGPVWADVYWELMQKITIRSRHADMLDRLGLHNTGFK